MHLEDRFLDLGLRSLGVLTSLEAACTMQCTMQPHRPQLQPTLQWASLHHIAAVEAQHGLHLAGLAREQHLNHGVSWRRLRLCGAIDYATNPIHCRPPPSP